MRLFNRWVVKTPTEPGRYLARVDGEITKVKVVRKDAGLFYILDSDNAVLYNLAWIRSDIKMEESMRRMINCHHCGGTPLNCPNMQGKDNLSKV